jgi:glutathione S-transferase
LQEHASVNEMMDWFNANFYKDFGYGFIYPHLYPHHKRADDAVQAGTIEWAMQKTHHWLKILDERLIGPHKTYLCGNTITLADYQGLR